MVLSDHLDMVGVTLKATYTQTRKANGDELQSRIKNTVGPWQTGKFMPLTQRPCWSANCYALSKVWFRCYCVDLRLLDITAINSKVKSWLYGDLLLKPEEMILFRPPCQGGLGLINIKIRSQACLIKTFLETASNPNFQQNIFHSTLFRYHVLGETSLPNPGTPPYYPPAFFSRIQQVHENSPLNITRMTLKQWYLLLLEDLVLMNDTAGQREYLPSKVEQLHPDVDWTNTWRLARLPGLGSEHCSFLFRLLHNLLPTRERLNRINSSSTITCRLCQDNIPEDQTHALFRCSFNNEAGQRLLDVLDTSPEKLLRLEVTVEDDLEFPATWLTSAVLLSIWSYRNIAKKIRLYSIRAEVESKVALLRETRYRPAAEKIAILLDRYN